MAERPPCARCWRLRPLLPALPTTDVETVGPFPLCSYHNTEHCCREDGEDVPSRTTRDRTRKNGLRLQQENLETEGTWGEDEHDRIWVTVGTVPAGKLQIQ